MKPIRMLLAAAFVASPALAMGAPAALAANADAPYQNVDHSNDNGNDTGNSKVEGLNNSQLNENYTGPVQLRAPAAGAPVVMAPVVQAPAGPAPVAPPPQ